MYRNQLLWGVILLLVGGLLLGDAMGLKLPNGMSLMGIFWPIILLFAGIWVILGVFVRGKIEVQDVSIDLQNAHTANLRIRHGAGELKVHSGANATELMRGLFTGGLDYKVNRNGDILEVRSDPQENGLIFPCSDLTVSWIGM